MDSPRLKVPQPSPAPRRAVKGEHESKQAVVKLFPAEAVMVQEARRVIQEESGETATVSEVLRFALRAMGKIDPAAFLAMREEMRTQDGRARRHAPVEHFGECRG